MRAGLRVLSRWEIDAARACLKARELYERARERERESPRDRRLLFSFDELDFQRRGTPSRPVHIMPGSLLRECLWVRNERIINLDDSAIRLSVIKAGRATRFRDEEAGMDFRIRHTSTCSAYVGLCFPDSDL